MNSVLQALAHTPPLAELFLSPRSDRLLAEISGGRVPDEGYDPVAAMQQLVRKAFSTLVLAPKAHAASLRLINKRFRLGRQEDSHEFLRCLLDAMHEACLKRFKPKPPPELATTTFVYRIFGGRLRSQIECEGADYVSRTYDPFLDLSLEINRATSLERALSAFTAPEVLDGANKYRCPKNNKLVRAVKRISVEEAPNVLTVHLKRFEYGSFGAKINKKVEFGTQLDLRPYMSNTKGPQQIYELYGVLVHHGHSVNNGHYICYVKAANGLWHVCDDHRVSAVGERTVLEQRAYILFYVRQHPRSSAAMAAAITAAVHQARTGAGDAEEKLAAAAANGHDKEAVVAVLRRQREDDATSCRGAEQPEGQDGRNAKRVRHTAAVGAGPVAHVGDGKGTGQEATAASRAVPKSNTALAHMLANLVENKKQLQMPKRKLQMDNALTGQGLGEQQLEMDRYAQQGQQQHQQCGDVQGQRASVNDHQNNLAEISGHGHANGDVATSHPPAAKAAKFVLAKAIGAEAAGPKSAFNDSVNRQHRAMSSDSGQQQQQPEQQQHVVDSAERFQLQQQNHQVADGVHQARRVSLLKPLRGSLVCSRTSVWYATAGQLCHAAAKGGASSGKGRFTLSASVPPAAITDAFPEDAGTWHRGQGPRPPSGHCETATPPPAVSHPNSPHHHIHKSLEDKFDALGSPENRDQSVPNQSSRRSKDDGTFAAVDLPGCLGPSTTGQLRDLVAGVASGRKKTSRLAFLSAQKSMAASDGEPDAVAGVSRVSQQGAAGDSARAGLDVQELEVEPSVRRHKRARQAAADGDGRVGPTIASPANGDVTKATLAWPGDAKAKALLEAPTQRQQPSAAAAKEVLTGQEALSWLLSGDSGHGTSGVRARHAGAGSSNWEVDEPGVFELRQQAAQLNHTISGTKRHVPAGGREYDEWDEEYDRGRTKKVRNKGGGNDEGYGEDGPSLLRSGFNMFQRAASEGWRSDAKDGPGQTPGSGRSSRGRGRGRTPVERGVRTPGRGGCTPGGRGGRFGASKSPGRGWGRGRGWSPRGRGTTNR
ncbi:hypothetical protein VaNZ11_011833 [Volvox africanus]|uniref:ubiquitinyl hydrolase 1 n=1 Tax=Volvox africanus TaxID=51714 RepID=A0ABQ5SEB2_9CHLO|nr:hypothetical protein VaNZ11_011833 [Volvox africanus]